MTTPTGGFEGLSKKAHMKALEYSKNAKECGDLTVVPLGYVSKIVVDLLSEEAERRGKEVRKEITWIIEDLSGFPSDLISDYQAQEIIKAIKANR